ncbi:MAG TPA: Hpt domain-containing protein [Cytophagaceae bacterium]
MEGDYINLEELYKLSGNDPEFIEKMILVFVEETPKSFIEIKEAMVAGNRKQVSQIAHHLKTSAYFMGIQALYNHAQKLEYIYRGYEEGDAESLMKLIEESFNKASEELIFYINNMRGKS